MSNLPDKILEDVLKMMIDLNSSDLHWADGESLFFRVHGKLERVKDFDHITSETFHDITKQLLGDESFNMLVSKKEFDGSCSIVGGRRVRINMYYKRNKIGWALRLLPNTFLSFEQLGLPDKICDDINNLKQGLVLITGATGSGKSTTLASFINHINNTREEHIFTIEDPIEYLHESKNCLVSQREVGSDTDDFKSALKHVLREDPDVVLLGEMRDKESIDAALTLAETSHLTFATLHTAGAVETISRIISTFEKTEQSQVRERIADNLKFVISQQLIPWSDGESRSLCPEIMVSTKAIKSMIRDNKERQMLSTIETSGREGMITMNKSLSDLVARRKISVDEALHYSPDKDALQKMF